jgi:hypothetical protein
MAPVARVTKKTSGKSKQSVSDGVVVEVDGASGASGVRNDSVTGDVSKEDFAFDPILVLFTDNSSVVYYDGKEKAQEIFKDSIRQICEGTTDELLKLKKFSDGFAAPVHGLTRAERAYSEAHKPVPALVKFKDGSAFVHFLGVEYMKYMLESDYGPDELEKLEFEEDEDFDKIERIATGYNQIASARKMPEEIESVKVAPVIFKKVSPTSTSQ